MSSLWLGKEPLLLASTSATRRILLESAGLPIAVEAPGVDERLIEAAIQGSPQDLTSLLAAKKALAVSCRRPARIVVGADQVLALDGAIMHKPEDGAAARRQLARLSGRTHHLHSAFAIAQDGAILRDGFDTARLTMRALDDAAIGRYLDLAGEDVSRSVGGYRLESVGVHLFERIEGDHTTILGLPLLRLLAALRSLGLLVM
ncbi:MAG: Maf family protein [Microvirga sp.]|jgi:septum formation protein|nr:nucleoside triphosphate pyrophosphatase [Beijerinckiaceae bacterium]